MGTLQPPGVDNEAFDNAALPAAAPAHGSPNVSMGALSRTSPSRSILVEQDQRYRAATISHGSEGQDLIDDDTLDLVDVLITDALQGRFTCNLDSPEKIARYRRYYSKAQTIALAVTFWIFLALILIEKPNGTLQTQQPFALTFSIELLCYCHFTYRLWEYRMITPRQQFWQEGKVLVVVACMVLTLVDAVVFLSLSDNPEDNNYARIGRVFRPILVINLSPDRLIRQGFRSVRRTVAKVFDVLAMLFVTIGVFTILFVKLYGSRHNLVDAEQRSYMKRYDDTWWQLYVLITTANFPDVMMPAYDENRLYCILFIVFLVVGLYVFTSILLAVVYENYRESMRGEIRDELQHRRGNLIRAFEVLKDEETDTMRFPQWEQVMKKMQPSASHGRVWLLWLVLDQAEKGSIGIQEWLQVCEVLNISVMALSSTINAFHRHIPTIYTSAPSEAFKSAVRHKAFSVFFDFIIILTVIMIVIDERGADPIFVALFAFEAASKIYALGFVNYFRDGWNRFDFFVALGAVVASIAAAAHQDGPYVEFILVLRVFRLVRIMYAYKGFRVILDTIANIGPAIYTYGAMVLLVYYMYAVVGMAWFGGKICEPNTGISGAVFDLTSNYSIAIHECNPKLENTQFAEDGYYLNNFNDPCAAFVTLFELTVVNQWHVIADGYVKLTDKWARLYFLSFNVLMVLIILNIFLAFVIEAFVLQLELETLEFEDVLMNKLEQELERSPALKEEYERTAIKKSRKMYVLLSHLFGDDDSKDKDPETIAKEARMSRRSSEGRIVTISPAVRQTSASSRPHSPA